MRLESVKGLSEQVSDDIMFDFWKQVAEIVQQWPNPVLTTLMKNPMAAFVA